MKTFRRPQQGTTRIVSQSTEKKIRAEVPKIVDRELTKGSDPELAALAKALSEKDEKTACELLPRLKERYGTQLYRLTRRF